MPRRVRIRGVALRTPLLDWDERTWLKPENLQPIGAFKIRGAHAKITSLSDAQRAAGVVTYSSGNHGQAVARSARLLGVRAVIVMPDNAPAVKVAGVERDGAEIVAAGPAPMSAGTSPRCWPRSTAYAIVPPFDDRRDHRRPGDRAAWRSPRICRR